MLCCEVARTTSNYVLDATNSQLHVACYAINLPKQLPATFLILRASNYVLDATLLTCSENFQVRSQIPTLLLMFLYWLVQTASNYVLDTTLRTEFHSNSLPSQSHNRSLAGSSRRRWNRAGTVVKRKFHQIWTPFLAQCSKKEFAFRHGANVILDKKRACMSTVSCRAGSLCSCVVAEELDSKTSFPWKCMLWDL